MLWCGFKLIYTVYQHHNYSWDGGGIASCISTARRLMGLEFVLIWRSANLKSHDFFYICGVTRIESETQSRNSSRATFIGCMYLRREFWVCWVSTCCPKPRYPNLVLIIRRKGAMNVLAPSWRTTSKTRYKEYYVLCYLARFVCCTEGFVISRFALPYPTIVVRKVRYIEVRCIVVHPYHF